MDLAALTLATFEPLVGDAFAVAIDAAGARSIEFVLASATSAGDWPGGRQPFSLVFRGPPEPLLPQAIYALQHAGARRAGDLRRADRARRRGRQLPGDLHVTLRSAGARAQRTATRSTTTS